MGCEICQCNKTCTSEGIFIVTPTLEGWLTKVKEGPSPHELRLRWIPIQYYWPHLCTSPLKNPGLLMWFKEASLHWVASGYNFNLMNTWHELAASSMLKMLVWKTQINYMTKDLPEISLVPFR